MFLIFNMFDYKNFDLHDELNKIKAITMKERAQDIFYLEEYTRIKYGEEVVNKVHQLLKENGFEIPDTSHHDPMDWIPATIPTAYMVGMIKVFNWNEDDIFELGRQLRAISPIIKFITKHFVTIKQSLLTAAKRWNTHYTEGKLELAEFDEINKRLVYRLKEFVKHPVTCRYLLGVITGLMELSVKKVVRSSENKCTFAGDDCHEFEVMWE